MMSRRRRTMNLGRHRTLLAGLVTTTQVKDHGLIPLPHFGRWALMGLSPMWGALDTLSERQKRVTIARLHQACTREVGLAYRSFERAMASSAREVACPTQQSGTHARAKTSGRGSRISRRF